MCRVPYNLFADVGIAVAEMEAEAAKLRELTAASDAAAASSSSSTAPSARPAATGDKDGDSFMSEEDKEVDSRSVYVGNVSAKSMTCVNKTPRCDART